MEARSGATVVNVKEKRENPPFEARYHPFLPPFSTGASRTKEMGARVSVRARAPNTGSKSGSRSSVAPAPRLGNRARASPVLPFRHRSMATVVPRPLQFKASATRGPGRCNTRQSRTKPRNRPGLSHTAQGRFTLSFTPRRDSPLPFNPHPSLLFSAYNDSSPSRQNCGLQKRNCVTVKYATRRPAQKPCRAGGAREDSRVITRAKERAEDYESPEARSATNGGGAKSPRYSGPTRLFFL